MKKFTGCIPLIAVAYVEIEAEDESEAMQKLELAYDNGEVDLMGLDNESSELWWVVEGDYI